MGPTAPRPRSLLFRLLVAQLLPILTLLGLFGFLTESYTARAMEASLGRQLIATAQAATTQINPGVVTFLGVGDDQSLSAQRLGRRLALLQRRTRVERIVIVDAQLRTKADTEKSTRIGDKHYHAEADRAELARVFRGEAASSVLFRGVDGRHYKTGYAPLMEQGRPVAAIAVVGNAAYLATISRLRRYFLLWGGVIALLVVGAATLIARRITRPLVALAADAARIGAGELQRPILSTSRGRDEVALLANTMNDMRRDLAARDEQMQIMLAGIAHEVRNPLGGISLFAGLLREDLEDEPERLEMVQRIERELAYLQQVVSDFLDFARRPKLLLAPLDLTQLLDEVVQLAGASAAAGGIRLALASHTTCIAQGDAEQIRRVMLNLVRNAIDASSTGDSVELSAGKEDGCPYFAIKDSGHGIDAEVVDQVFAPFFTTREQGTGLGLALSRKIIAEHGGAIEIQSTPKVGTTVRVWLPPVGESSGLASDQRLGLL